MKSRLFLLAMLVGATASAQGKGQRTATPDAARSGGKEYTDSRGVKVFFPLGELSFADEVVSYQMGKPAPVETETHAPTGNGPGTAGK